MSSLRSPEYLTFLLVRILGVGTKPLTLLVAGYTLNDEFATSYAVLISAIASLFVLTGAQTHIDYYNRRFSSDCTAFGHAFAAYFRASILQYVLAVPVIAAIALAWTSDTVVFVSILLLVGCEKFFDEDQRHFIFKKDYLGWCLSFSFRVIVPTGALLILLPAKEGVPVEYYVIFCIVSMVCYWVIRWKYLKFYCFLARKTLHSICRSSKSVLGGFATRWRQEYAFNQLWTFFSVNILLADRLWVANTYQDRIDEYVFFANIFNIVNVGHSLIYFTRRRPEIIRRDNHSGWDEFSRTPNLLWPVGLMLVCGGIAMLLRATFDIYAEVSPILLLGFAALFVVYAASLVSIDYAFWRLSRRWLVCIDGALVAATLGALFWIQPPIEWAPFISAGALLARVVGYQALLAIKQPAVTTT